MNARIAGIYADYTHLFKPLLARVEAECQELPAQILNEIRAVFDHISRCYWDDASRDTRLDNLLKARGHLKRACLDCTKMLILTLHVRVEDFRRETRCVDLTVVNNGAWYPEFVRLRAAAVRATQEAKGRESRSGDTVEFDFYQLAVNAWDDAWLHIEQNLDSINWSRRRSIVGRNLAWLRLRCDSR